jgi:Protein of unknown function (DUF2800)
MSAHAACSPSSAAMWLACPASVTLTKHIPRPSSKYAREGTAAHAVAEMILDGDVFLPDKVEVEGEEFIVSPGMCRALNPYVSYVQSLMRLPKRSVYLEQHLYVPDTDHMVWGTLDCGVHARGTGDIYIADLKFGRGHIVDPDTPQLKLYALGLAGYVRENRAFAEVTLTICQPRVGGEALRSVRTTLGALWDWQALTVNPAVTRIIAGHETEHAGPHCRWCVRQTECEAFARQHQNRTAAVFDDADLF